MAILSVGASAMNENEFWKVIQQIRGDDDEAAHSRRLEKALRKMPPAEIRSFGTHFMRAEKQADTDRLWAAANLMTRMPCGDDCFLYFRRWLISRGRDVYYAALTDADSLARLSENGPAPQFESLWDAVPAAYEKVAKSPYNDIVANDVREHGDPNLSKEYFAKNLPLLWAKFERDFERSQDGIRQQQLSQSPTVFVPGIGSVAPGTRLRYKDLGGGVVVAVMHLGIPMARVRFDEGERTITLSPDSVSIEQE